MKKLLSKINNSVFIWSITVKFEMKMIVYFLRDRTI